MRRNHRQEAGHDPGLRRRRHGRPGHRRSQAGPCLVVQRKTVEQDGYERRPARPRRGRSRPSSVDQAVQGPLREGRRGADAARSRSSRLDEGEDAQGRATRSRLCDRSSEQDCVDVVGTSKGKGFQGVVKRHNFRGGARHPRLDVPPRARARSAPRRIPSRVMPGHARRRPDGRRAGRRSRTCAWCKVDAEKNLIYLARRGAGCRATAT